MTSREDNATFELNDVATFRIEALIIVRSRIKRRIRRITRAVQQLLAVCASTPSGIIGKPGVEVVPTWWATGSFELNVSFEIEATRHEAEAVYRYLEAGVAKIKKRYVRITQHVVEIKVVKNGIDPAVVVPLALKHLLADNSTALRPAS